MTYGHDMAPWPTRISARLGNSYFSLIRRTLQPLKRSLVSENLTFTSVRYEPLLYPAPEIFFTG